MILRIGHLLLAVVLSVIFVNSRAEMSYRITDLSDSLDGNRLGGFVSSINNAGQVVGHADVSGSAAAMLWSASGGTHALGYLPSGISISSARSINNAGQVVGVSYGGNSAPNAFLWSAEGGIKDLGGPPGTSANGINDAGQVVGSSLSSNGYYQAFIWSTTDGMHQLGGPSDYVEHSYAQAINNAGQAVGFIGNYAARAFIWSEPDGIRILESLQPEYGWGGDTLALDINDAGQVIGYSGFNAFLWTATSGMQDLGDLAGVITTKDQARSINAHGQVVGWSDNSAGYQGFLWSSQEGMLALNDLIDVSDPLHGLVSISDAMSINDVGQIAASGFINGARHVFLLTPVAVPEPSSFALMLMGVGAIVRSRRALKIPCQSTTLLS
jgi:probable HAF family extracellular repeat protein